MKKLFAGMLALCMTCASYAGIPVLMYHEIVTDSSNIAPGDTVVTVSAFNAQMKWLRDNNYYTISATELATYMATNQLTTVRNKQPIVITFDDGWYNQQNALPALNKYKFKAVFNIIGSLPGTDPSYMNWKTVKKIVAAGHEIGSHTMRHPLRMAPEDVNYEVIQSKNTIESVLQRQIYTIAWPNGYFNDGMTNVAKSIGYSSAQTIDENWCSTATVSLEGTPFCQWLTGNTYGQNPYLIKRVFVDGRCTTTEIGTWITQGHSSECAFVAQNALPLPSLSRSVVLPANVSSTPNMTDDDESPRHHRDHLEKDNDGSDYKEGNKRLKHH
jgi:peptidoglycan/xylan/chitin deacetylase (PgdA/CDA1 family)